MKWMSAAWVYVVVFFWVWAATIYFPTHLQCSLYGLFAWAGLAWVALHSLQLHGQLQLDFCGYFSSYLRQLEKWQLDAQQWNLLVILFDTDFGKD